MTNFAILRVQKYKSMEQLRRAQRHHARTQPVSHASGSGSIKTLIDPGNLCEAVTGRIEQLTGSKRIRKNAVPAVEILMTASPSYFRRDTEAAGTYDPDRTRAWCDRTMEWLRSQYGNRIVAAWLHLDESTPHIHAVVVPITKDGRLAARDLYGPADLRNLQTSYAQAMAPLGLARGIPGSRAQHVPLRQYYADVTRAEVTHPPRTEAEIRSVLRRAVAHDVARRQAQEIHATASFLADQLRDVDLPTVLHQLGFLRSRKDLNQYRADGHRITVSGSKWYDHEAGRGGGGAIDLVMHVLRCKAAGAISWLAHRFGHAAAAASVRASADQVVSAATQRPPPSYVPPARDDEAWPTARRWLIRTRGIPANAVDELHARGQVYATRHRNGAINVVFTGDGAAEVRGTGPQKYAVLAPGSNRDHSFAIRPASARKLVLVESALDAIAYWVLHPDPDTWIVSTAGVRSWHPAIDQALAAGMQVACAYDRDEAGDRAASQMIDRAATKLGSISRELPTGSKDWNDMLMAAGRSASSLSRSPSR